ncbi:hypothetical protein O181_103525 [Austropuccinia psidii MF-1]|uniref:Uncharacterized protein n=1 Tax=Austropuccinia psidii MF-1 TaxID=1389203 RepID=A0A9Q3PJV5_9BASI|nr:hypothetical protein [Austropuccinia psidii MF-1]
MVLPRSLAFSYWCMRRLLLHRLHAYAPAPPSRSDSNSASPSLPSPLLTLPHLRLIFSLDYNPYVPAGHSSYASNTTLTPPCASLNPPNPIHHLPYLRLWSAFPTCLQPHLPSLCSCSAHST